MDEIDKEKAVFIGKKPFMSYMYSASLLLKKNKEILIVARGRKNIGIAVDIADATTHKEEDVKIDKVTIGSEEFEREGKKTRVSEISIVLKKK